MSIQKPVGCRACGSSEGGQIISNQNNAYTIKIIENSHHLNIRL